jgi:hypothetical protein
VAVPDDKAVFINVPFDPSYEPLFVTLVGGLVFLGQDPHCVLEVREKGDGRLIRIVELMRSCRLSIHDLSRTGMPARFNMPFELGLASALKIADPNAYEVLVLESQPYRLDKTLSDYKGRDPLIHHGTSDGMIASLLDAFVSKVPNPAKEFRDAARLLRKSVALLKREMNTTSLFRPALFRLVLLSATKIGDERGFMKS